MSLHLRTHRRRYNIEAMIIVLYITYKGFSKQYLMYINHFTKFDFKITSSHDYLQNIWKEQINFKAINTFIDR